MKIQECPSWEEIINAVHTLGNQWLHVYQLLYSKKLASPYHDAKLIVTRVFTGSTMTALLSVEVPHNKKGLYFRLNGTEGDDVIMHKVQLLLDGQEMEIKYPQACCPHAMPIQCVCAYSYKCELHGDIHIGTHD